MSQNPEPDTHTKTSTTPTVSNLTFQVFDGLFWFIVFAMSASYVVLILLMLGAGSLHTTGTDFSDALANNYIQYSIRLSLISCTITAILSIWIAIPIGYLMSRIDFHGKTLIDAILDIPIVLPPLVIGLLLLIMFQTSPVQWFEEVVLGGYTITYSIASVIIAQFSVACAFAVRTMRTTFDSIGMRREQVALTLGCSRNQAFWMVVLPEARRGIFTAGTMAWARALGEFGPILVFAGSMRNRTEVLPTTIFLEISVGNIDMAVAVSLIMVLAAVVVLVLVRMYGQEQTER